MQLKSKEKNWRRKEEFEENIKRRIKEELEDTNYKQKNSERSTSI